MKKSSVIELRKVLVEKLADYKGKPVKLNLQSDVLDELLFDHHYGEKEGHYKDFAEEISERYEDFTDSVGERFDHFEAGIGRRLDYLKDNAKALGDKMIPDSGKKVVDEIVNLTERYTNAIKEHASFSHIKSKIKKFFIMNIIRSNPTITSDEYKEALEDLKSSQNK